MKAPMGITIWCALRNFKTMTAFVPMTLTFDRFISQAYREIYMFPKSEDFVDVR